jgi:hypothetical protein
VKNEMAGETATWTATCQCGRALVKSDDGVRLA